MCWYILTLTRGRGSKNPHPCHSSGGNFLTLWTQGATWEIPCSTKPLWMLSDSINDKGMILNNLQLKPARNTSCFYAYFDGIIIPWMAWLTDLSLVFRAITVAEQSEISHSNGQRVTNDPVTNQTSIQLWTCFTSDSSSLNWFREKVTYLPCILLNSVALDPALRHWEGPSPYKARPPFTIAKLVISSSTIDNYSTKRDPRLR